jgi:hypothetical protein
VFRVPQGIQGIQEQPERQEQMDYLDLTDRWVRLETQVHRDLLVEQVIPAIQVQLGAPEIQDLQVPPVQMDYRDWTEIKVQQETLGQPVV